MHLLEYVCYVVEVVEYCQGGVYSIRVRVRWNVLCVKHWLVLCVGCWLVCFGYTACNALAYVFVYGVVWGIRGVMHCIGI